MDASKGYILNFTSGRWDQSIVTINRNTKKNKEVLSIVDDFGETEFVYRGTVPNVQKQNTKGYDWAVMLKTANGERKFIPAQFVTMRPELPGSTEENENADGEGEGNSAETQLLSNEEKRAELAKKFGSKKAKQIFLHRELKRAKLSMEIGADSGRNAENNANDLVAESLIKEIDSKKLKKDDEGGTPETLANRSSVLPNVNENVEKPEDYYSMSDLIAEVDEILLDESAAKLIETTSASLKESGWSEFLVKLHSKFQNAGPKSEKTRKKMAHLLYLHYLVSLQIHSASKIGFQINDCIPDSCPEELKGKLKDLFTEFGRYKGQMCLQVRKIQRDRLLTHAVIISILLDENLTIPVYELVKEWNSSASAMEKICRAIGCQVSKQHGTATLCRKPSTTYGIGARRGGRR